MLVEEGRCNPRHLLVSKLCNHEKVFHLFFFDVELPLTILNDADSLRLLGLLLSKAELAKEAD